MSGRAIDSTEPQAPELKMKILIYQPSNLTRHSGSPIHGINVARALAKLGNQIEMAGIIDTPTFPEITWHTLPKARPLELKPWKLLSFLRHAIALKRLVSTVKPDLIYIQTHGGLVLGIAIGKLTGVPVVADIHEAPFSSGRNATPVRMVVRNFRTRIYSKCIASCLGVTVSNRRLGKTLAAVQRNIYVFPGGANTETFHPRVPLAEEIQSIRKESGILVAYVGNFRFYQGLDLLIEAASELARRQNGGFKFLLVGGNDPDILNLRKTLDTKGLGDSFELLGRRAYDIIPSYIAAADILTVPRRRMPITENAFPCKLAEYMSMGKAIVVTDVGDHAEMVSHLETGLLVEPNPSALADAFLALEDSEMRNRLGKAAREYAVNSLSWDKLCLKLQQLFENWLQVK